MDSNDKSRIRLLWIAGIAMAFPFILAGGPLAGYYVGQFILVKHFGLRPMFVPILIIIGFAGSAYQIFSLIRKMKQMDTENK